MATGKTTWTEFVRM